MAINMKKVMAFAQEKHRGQVRKYTGESYFEGHLREVATLVSGHARWHPNRDAMVAAAWLHDTIEDCGVTEDEILLKFGAKVSRLVWWLSDASKPMDGNRAQRKEIDRAHIARAPEEAQLVKCADLVSNTRSIVRWGKKFAGAYLDEKRSVLDVLDKTHGSRLRELAEDTLAYAYLELEG